MEKVKFSDVEAFIRFLIKLGGIYTVDGEGYIANKGDDADDTPVLLKIKNSYKRLQIIKEVITDNDAVVINPLNENLREAPDSRWLYTTLAVGLSRRVIELIRFINIAKDLSNDTEVGLSTEVMRFVAPFSKRVNDKTIEQLNEITKQKTEFMNVWYRRKFKEARFRCNIYDADIATKFPKVTKKTWKLLHDIMGAILHISNEPTEAAAEIIDKFSSTSKQIKSPKLEAILLTYHKIYSEINRYLGYTEMEDADFVIDMSEFDVHINRIEAYYDKTKWFTGTIDDEPVAAAAPVAGINTAGISTNSGSSIPMNPHNLGNMNNTEVPIEAPVSSTMPPNLARLGLNNTMNSGPTMFANQGQDPYPSQAIRTSQASGGFVPIR